MTGVNINKIRHYAPGFNSRTTRLDVDTAALIFKAGNRIISNSERLIADVSVKAAMPTSPNTDDKKRGLQSAGQSKYVNYAGVVFDPEAKKQPGQYFKSYVTENERIEAMRSSDPVPNWGWLDKDAQVNKLPKPINAVAKITRYPVNPKTGAPMKNYGFEPEIKSLGKTIGESNPALKIGVRAAIAMGIVVDALGKFRCPAGTPAANRFTNERGEGCFSVTTEQIENIASSITNALQAPTDRTTIVASLLAIGVTAAEVRKEYKKNGLAGLASIASRLGFRTGEKGDDASYMAAIPAKIREAMGASRGAKARMERVREEKRLIINELRAKYNITEPDEYLAMAQIFEAMGNDPDAPFGPGQFQKLFVGGTPENHKKWAIETLAKMHIAAIRAKTGLVSPEDIVNEYNRAKGAGETTDLTRFIDAGLLREKQFRTGAFRQALVDAFKNPEQFKNRDGQYFEFYCDYERTDGSYEFKTLNGMAGPGAVYIGSGPALLGYRDAPPDGYMDLYEATGGDVDDQWRAITEALADDERTRRWAFTYSTDLAAEYGNGWEDFGAQTSAHEITHISQYEAIIDYFKRAYPGGYTNPRTGETYTDFDDLNNDSAFALVMDFMGQAGTEQFREVFGVDIEDLIEKRYDALAGAYSQVKQQDALNDLRRGDAEAFQRAKALALLETLAELGGNRAVGLIGDDPELDGILDNFIPMDGGSTGIPPSPSGIIVPGSPTPNPGGGIILPGAPAVPNNGELIIPGRRPDVPIDAPQPVRPGRRPATPLSPDAPTLRPGDGQPTRPQRRPGRRRPRGPVDMFDKKRNGKVPTMIREQRFTNQDIEEHLFGENGKGGLFGMFRSAKNMRIRQGSDRNMDRTRKELLNELIDTMGVSFEELEAMARKIQNGEKLTPEERKQLTNAIAHLRNGLNEFRRKAEEARERYRNYRGVDTSNDFNDKDANVIALEGIQAEIEMYEKLAWKIGREFAPAVHDILTMDENGPYPDRLEGYRPGSEYFRTLGVVGDSQNSLLTPEELSAIDNLPDNNPPIFLASSSSSIEKIEMDISDSLEISEVFSRYGMTAPKEKDSKPLVVMTALDKMSLPEDVVVEIEIDIDESSATTPGSMYSLPSIQSGKVVSDQPRRGLASESMFDMAAARSASGVVGRLIGSKKGRKLIEKLGVDPERADMVQLMSEVAIGFSVGGPGGAILPLARRGSRDAAEKALQVAVERGMIDQNVADKIIKFGLDRIAKEGLPDEILRAAEATKDALMTEENKRKAIEMGATFQERSLELTAAARERASQVTESAKEQAAELTEAAKQRAAEMAEATKRRTTELTGSLGDRWKKKRTPDSLPIDSDPFASPPDPSTGAYPLSSPPDVTTRSGLASTSSSYSTSESREYLVSSVEKFQPSKVKTENPIDAGNLYDGGALLETTSYEIGGKKVIFGNPKDFEGQGIDAEIIPLNPFEISGLSKNSEEGQKVAIDWYFARVASTEQARDVIGTNHVEALLYAASKGDTDAKKQLEELSRRGKELTEAKKRELARTYTDEKKAEIASKFQAGRLPTSEDLVAVRQISFPPKFDDEGNLLLENASDYDKAVKFEEDGSESKERYKPFRKSVHFTINAPIEAHPLWKPGENDYIIVVDFAKMLEANPGSIDNLFVEDTFLTGKPGEPLKIPKGFFTYERIEGKDRGQIVRDGMDALGKGKEFIFEIGTGGEGTGTREHMADALNIISQEELNIEIGVLHQQHSLNIEKFMDSFTQVTTGVKPADEGINRLPDFPSTAGTASGISINSILALAENLNWSDAKLSAAIKSIV
jgi:hypothetical protein